MKECKHERVVAYTEDGARYHACRDCGEVFPQPGPTNEPPPVGQPTPRNGEHTTAEGDSSDLVSRMAAVLWEALPLLDCNCAFVCETTCTKGKVEAVLAEVDRCV